MAHPVDKRSVVRQIQSGFSGTARPPHVLATRIIAVRSCRSPGTGTDCPTDPAPVPVSAWIGVRLQERHARHDEAGMQKAHWKPCSSMTPCWTGCSVPSGLARLSMVRTFLVADCVFFVQHRARIVGHAVDQNGAGAAFGPGRTQLRAGESQFCGRSVHASVSCFMTSTDAAGR